MRCLGRHFFGKNPRGSCSLELCRRALCSSLPNMAARRLQNNLKCSKMKLMDSVVGAA